MSASPSKKNSTSADENQLPDSNASKETFYGIIAHDLRSPFNAIIGFSELLMSDYSSFDDKEKFDMIKNIHEASTSAYKLLENLMEWSRIQSGKTIPRPESVYLSTIVTSGLIFIRDQAETKGIKISSSIPAGIIVYCDENMITSVIRNLLSNAVKYTFPGGCVHIEAETRDQDIELSLSDDGVGIAPENMDKLFRPEQFFRTRGTAGESGTGLGLIICRELMELNGGKIRAESKQKTGSRFIISLPKN